MKFLKNLFKLIFWGLLIFAGKKLYDLLKKLKDNNGTTIFFNGLDKKFEDEIGDEQSYNLIFSGMKLDMSELKTDKKQIEINIYGLFSGADIRIPKNANVQLDGVNSQSGISNNADDIENAELIIIINYEMKYSGLSVKR